MSFFPTSFRLSEGFSAPLLLGLSHLPLQTNSCPTNIGIAMGTLSVATLVSHGVDIWVALVKVFISLIYHLYSVSTPGLVLEE